MPVTKRWLKLTDADRYSYGISLAPTGQAPEHTVLVLIDGPSIENSEYILDEESLETYDNVIGYALSRETERPASVGVVLACPDRASRQSSFQVEALKLFKAVKPDAILVANQWAARSLFGDAFVDHYGYLREFKFESTDIDGNVNTYRCPSCYTVDVLGWTDPEPKIKGDNGGGYVNLIGQFVRHLQTAVRGWNRHSIIVPAIDDLQITTVDTIEKFDRFYDQLLNTETPCFDTETENLNRVVNKLLTMQWLLPTDREDGWYDLFFIPYAHRESEWTGEELRYIKTKLRQYFETCRSRYIIGHGLKFDLTQITNQLGVRWMNHRCYDTIAGEFLLDENRKFLIQIGFNSKAGKGPYSLTMLERGLGYRRPETIMGKERRTDMANVPLEEIKPYGMIDVITPYLAHKCQMAEARHRGYNNYLRHVADQLSMTITMMSSMEAVGIAADASYLQKMTLPTSEINTTIAKAIEDFKASPVCQKINDEMVKARGWQPSGMFGSTEKPWLFDVSNQATVQRLCFDELKLEPLSHTPTGTPQIDKRFIAAYINVPEIAILGEKKKMETIKNTFIDGLHTRLVTEADAIITGRIFPDFNYTGVLSGRGSSSNPNSQNQPSQGPLAKLVKRVWISPLGKLLLKPDYSAHEVRGLGNVSGDPKVREVFAIADEAVFRARIANLEDLPAAIANLKANGDVHILNVKFFFNKVVDKAHPLRYGIKAVVFGVIYGKGAFSLGVDLKGGLVDAVKALKKAIAKAAPDADMRAMTIELETSEATLNSRTDEDWKDEAQGLIDKLNENWNVGSRWIKQVHADGQENLVVFSQIGWPRHLSSYLHASRRVKAAMNRRGPNSIIQGFSSQTGYAAAYVTKREIWHTFVKRGLDIGMFQVNTVHDSLTNEVNFEAAAIGMYLLEHGMTTLTMRHYKDTYDVDTPVPYGFGFELGHRESDMIEWKDQRFDSMANHLTKFHGELMARQSAVLIDGKLPITAASEFSGRILSASSLTDALHNLDRIAAVRHQEIREGKGEMKLERATGWYEKNMLGL